ncbi:GyrI-like domain-containing protein [Legionella hackeliae]|nr:GyrI-like domain-containing protein [Legionella hackeliae]KTD14204.1 Transcription activator [Legionella hackeliae]STX47149.1 Transcription activator, effector binding [Legionella hackeliae]
MIFLKPQLIKIEGFIVSGIHVRTKNSDELNPKTAKLPQLWQRFHTENIANVVQNDPDSQQFGVYSDYESDVSGAYTLTAGVKTDNVTRIPGCTSIYIEPGNYLLFQNHGSMPQAIIELWQGIWRYFSFESRFVRRYLTDFEVYKNSEECAVYIGVVE